MSPDGPEAAFKQHPLVERLVPDPNSPPPLVLLIGFLGRGTDDGHRRLYREPELRSWLRIPTEAILHSERLPQDVNLWGQDVVWLDPTTMLSPGRVESGDGQDPPVPADLVQEPGWLPAALLWRQDPLWRPPPLGGNGGHGPGSASWPPRH
jgi:hypothetical protein